MKFNAKTIAPAGRNKYGNYVSSTNVTKSVISTTYVGNDTTTTIGPPQEPEEKPEEISFYCMLSKSSMAFDALELVHGTTADTTVITYRGYDKAPALVCDMGAITATTGTDGQILNLEVPANSGITYLPEGITVSIRNNGSSASTIIFDVDNSLSGNSGTIKIPVCVYKRSNAIPEAENLYDWYDSAYNVSSDGIEATTDCEEVWLDFVWSVNRAAASNYVMDLSNQTAGVNCDENGHIYSASTATLTCSATTHQGTTLLTAVTYSLEILPRYNAIGVHISQDGVMTWDSNFSFDGPALPIDVVANLNGTDIATKTMTISKNYPGMDGSPAVTRWIETDKTFIKYNPNSNQYSETAVTGTVWKQVGSGMPATDTGYTICQWFDDKDYQGASSNTGTITAHLYNTDTISGVSFGLGYQGHWYEHEEVPVIFEGKNGGEGPQGPQGGTGPQGPQGQGGSAGESVYHMTLDNDNASINCNSDGTIMDGAYRPSCRVKLYYGTERVTNPTYAVNVGGATGVTTSTTNGILTIATSSSTFNFTGDTLVISITAKTSNTTRDIKEMTITKSIAGANGNTPYISGGTWWINGVDTGIQAEGSDGPQGPQGQNGNTPYIGPNGNWWIGNQDTGIKAEGQDAVSYWLALSGDEILLNPNDNTIVPSYASATSYMQIGQQDPEPASGVTIKACWVLKHDGSEAQESATTLVNFTQQSFNNYSMLRFKLYKGDKRVDMEEVSMMTDGKNGGAGPQGPQGIDGNDGESTWYLSLSNDNASINCDSSGNVLTGAYHPYTDCKLMYGMVQDTGATYSYEVYDGINEIDDPVEWGGIDDAEFGRGVKRIYSTSGLQFTSTTLTVLITAYDSNETIRDRRAFTISKSIAGANGENGEDATSYWLELSTQDMIYDRDSGKVSPSGVSVSAYKQVGEEAPRPASEAVIKYKRVYRGTGGEETGETTYTTPLVISDATAAAYSIFRFRLYVDGYQRDMEDLGILMNGQDGQNGTSVQGPAVRGPYDYGQYSATSRCWCSGESGVTPCTDCDRWIDVMLKDGVYYYCNHTYNGTPAEGFLPQNNYWTAGERFDFIAAGLILASGASINFLSNNELYLKDGDTITGGARGGSGYTFWAGQQYPEDAPFRVDTNGSFSSTTGMIGGWEYNNSGFTWAYESGENGGHASFDQNKIEIWNTAAGPRSTFRAGLDGISFEGIELTGDVDALSIKGDYTNVKFNGIGLFNCEKLIVNSSDSNIQIYDTLEVHDDIRLGNNQYGVVKSLFNSDIKMAFVTTASTSASYFTRVVESIDDGGVNTFSAGTWYFNNDMPVAKWSQNGGYGLYMIQTTTGMCRVEVEITLIEDVGNTYKTWRNGNSAAGYVLDVLLSGSTFYRCNYNYTGKLNWSSNSWRWTADTWNNIISTRYFEGDEMKKMINSNYPSSNQIGLPYRLAGMWCACGSASPTSSSNFIKTGIFGPNFNNRKGDTLYIEV